MRETISSACMEPTTQGFASLACSHKAAKTMRWAGSWSSSNEVIAYFFIFYFIFFFLKNDIQNKQTNEIQPKKQRIHHYYRYYALLYLFCDPDSAEKMLFPRPCFHAFLASIRPVNNLSQLGHHTPISRHNTNRIRSRSL